MGPFGQKHVLRARNVVVLLLVSQLVTGLLFAYGAFPAWAQPIHLLLAWRVPHVLGPLLAHNLPLNGPHPDHRHSLGLSSSFFRLTDAVTGTTVTSDDVFAGGPTVVVFMCNHCPFVVHILEAFVAFASECRDKGVNVVAISSNDVANYPQDDVPLMKVGRIPRLHVPLPLRPHPRRRPCLRRGVHPGLQRV